jgi:GNAT superfamily N-acetyltransferase
VKRELPGGYELDDDPARIDVRTVHGYLCNDSYWAHGRPLEVQERLIREATRVVGLYKQGRQVGFSRAVSDGVVFSYLADVYVLPEHQGRGLGVELVRFSVEEGPLAGLRWLLHTHDAHGLYEKLGFGAPPPSAMQREARREAKRVARCRGGQPALGS